MTTAGSIDEARQPARNRGADGRARCNAMRRVVPRAGLEPARLAAADFKSAVSTVPPPGPSGDSTRPGRRQRARRWPLVRPLPRRSRSSEQPRQRACRRAGATGLCSSRQPLAWMRASSSGWLSPDTITVGSRRPRRCSIVASAARPSLPTRNRKSTIAASGPSPSDDARSRPCRRRRPASASHPHERRRPSVPIAHRASRPR